MTIYYVTVCGNVLPEVKKQFDEWCKARGTNPNKVIVAYIKDLLRTSIAVDGMTKTRAES